MKDLVYNGLDAWHFLLLYTASKKKRGINITHSSSLVFLSALLS